MGYNKSIMKKKILLSSFIFLLLDQIIKLIINKVLIIGNSINVCDQFFYLTKAYNTGISFSMLSGHKYIIILFSLLALIFLYIISKKFKNNKRNIIAFALVLGGLFGNLMDRIIYGYVIDFLDFKIFGYDYPIFNIADSFIFIGVILLVYAILIGEDHENNS